MSGSPPWREVGRGPQLWSERTGSEWDPEGCVRERGPAGVAQQGWGQGGDGRAGEAAASPVMGWGGGGAGDPREDAHGSSERGCGGPRGDASSSPSWAPIPTPYLSRQQPGADLPTRPSTALCLPLVLLATIFSDEENWGLLVLRRPEQPVSPPNNAALWGVSARSQVRW